MSSTYKRGDRVVVNCANIRGIAGKVLAQSKSTKSLSIQLDDRAHAINVMPYEVQREEVWLQTHDPNQERHGTPTITTVAVNAGKLKKRAKNHAHLMNIDHAAVAEWRATSWMAGYAAALKDVREVVKNAGGPEHNVGADVMMWLEEQP